MTLEELLRSAARDVADAAPDTYVGASDIRAQALSVRRRQRVGLTAGLVAATAVVAVGLQVLGGGTKDAQEPMPAPSPSPSATPGASTAPGVPVVETPEITADDLREYEELGTMTNAQPGNEGLTELTFEVPVTDRYTYEWSHFCTGDPDTWYVIIVGDGGASGSGYCDQPASDPFPAFPSELSAMYHSGAEPATQEVRMFLVDEIPAKHQKCFDKKSPAECMDLTPPLEPLASSDVSFGISVYEYWAPAVAQVLGYDLGARMRIDGTDYLLSQVLTPGAGQHEFSTTLPAVEGDRLVGILDIQPAAIAECHQAAGADLEAYRACDAFLELRIGDRTVSLDRKADADLLNTIANGGFMPGLFRVPAGEQEVEVRVASGDPDHIDFALVVFEETL